MYAIFYKEWIKTRWYFLLAVLATLGFTGYCMLRINRVVEMKGAAHVWEVMLQRDVIFIDMLDRKSTRLNSSHYQQSRMPSSA